MTSHAPNCRRRHGTRRRRPLHKESHRIWRPRHGHRHRRRRSRRRRFARRRRWAEVTARPEHRRAAAAQQRDPAGAGSQRRAAARLRRPAARCAAAANNKSRPRQRPVRLLAPCAPARREAACAQRACRGGARGRGAAALSARRRWRAAACARRPAGAVPPHPCGARCVLRCCARRATYRRPSHSS